MRDLRWILVTLVVAGCGESNHHAYSLNEVTSENHKCGYDAVRPGLVNEFGQPVRYWLPCWDWSKDTERYRTRTQPAARATLAKIEATQCVGLMPAALERSPFVQDRAIAEIIPRRAGDTIHGARIVFNPVPGLTISWMRRAVACHRARWKALGYPADYLTGDPTLIRGTEVEITGNDNHIAVLIESDSEATGKLVLARARGLVPERAPVARLVRPTWRKE